MSPILKLISIILLPKVVKTELYAEYSDYEDQNFGEASYDQERDHKDNQDQVNRYPVADRLVTGLNNDLSEHTLVTDNNVFPYMAAVLKGSKYLSSGALIDQRWVLTTGDGMFLLRESIRLLRVRIGSINYKKGGLLLPVKLIEIHPHFDDKKPNFDLALLMLAVPIRYTPTMSAIRLQLHPQDISATHFLITSWTGPLSKRRNSTRLQSMEMIKRNRVLTVTHLHPSDPLECTEELKDIGAKDEAIMCLDANLRDPCLRDVGAPVVLNHVLWGVVSSWRPEECGNPETDAQGSAGSMGPVFATRVSARNVSTWIHATVHGQRWNHTT